MRSEWAKTVDDIRQLKGLETFLLPPPYEHLQKAASDGPVVILNITKRRSDAVVLLASGDPILVPLPGFTPDAILALADCLGERPAERHPDDVICILREIWGIIVSPIVYQLLADPIRLRKCSRIWW